jgi:hypothetical protein
MKKMVFCVIPLIVALMGCASRAETNNISLGMDLDAAIREAAVQMGENLPGGTVVAIVSVASSSAQFSEYVISRLEAALVSGKKLVVVDRANLDKVREEQGFQLSGEVDDNSAKVIGKLLGAGAIVTGSFTNLGDVYSLTLKAINIETATIAVSYPADIAKSTRIETLLASGGGAARTQTAQRGNTGGNTTAPAAPIVPAVPPVPAPRIQPGAAEAGSAPANGTYSFLPRLRAFSGAREVNVYLHRVVVRNGYVTIYLQDVPTETLRFGWDLIGLKLLGSWSQTNTVLKDLDNPSRVYYLVENSVSIQNGFCTFKNVTGTRFSLTTANDTADRPPIVFDEIILDKPD